MFWKTENYDTPVTEEPVDALLTKFAAANEFNLLEGNSPNTFVLNSPSNLPSLSNLFTLKLFVQNTADKRRISIEVAPQTWLLGAMLLFVVLAVIALKFDFAFRRIVGISIPLLFLTPYYYAVIGTQVLMELKHHLIPGFLETKEGRIEQQQKSFSPLKLFLNIQQYAYITFVVVFIFVLLLWMTGVIESLNPSDWFKK